MHIPSADNTGSDSMCILYGESVNTGLDWTGLEYWNDL